MCLISPLKLADQKRTDGRGAVPSNGCSREGCPVSHRPDETTLGTGVVHRDAKAVSFTYISVDANSSSTVGDAAALLSRAVRCRS